MDREVVLTVLSVLLVGSMLPLGAWLAMAVPITPRFEGSGRVLEQVAARRLVLPAAPALVALIALFGWAMVEPDDSERVPWLAFAATLPVFVVWGRAALRAAKALAPQTIRTAATMGLLSPRVVVSPEFRAKLGEAELSAAIAHEEAHVRRRDPLRIWLAQILTDLQWPVPGARERLSDWITALEIARDDEARAKVEGADLATAILAAVRLEQAPRFFAARVASPGKILTLRIERLLEPAPPPGRDAGVHVAWVFGVVVLGGALFVGADFGEWLVRHALGWTR